MRKKTLAFVFILLFAVFGFLFARELKAGPDDNVWGWAWSSNLGWISFNCDNPELPEPRCAYNYGVNIKEDGTFEGYAWSRGTRDDVGGIGWITFNQNELSECPSGDCRAWVGEDGKVYGWARAYRPINPEGQTLGGWTGWIKFDHGQANQVYIDEENGDFHGYAWGGGGETKESAVIGWISFNCADRDVCGASDYKVMTSFSFIPVPNVSNLESNFIAPCSQSRIPTFSWQTDAQMPYDYEIQLCSNPDCSGSEDPLVYSLVENTNSNSWGPACTLCCNLTDYNKIEFGGNTYSGQVRARNTGGQWSDWAKDNFTTYNHCYPWIDFSWAPERPSVNELVQFVDQSEVYGGAVKSSWSWIFEYGNPATSSLQNPTTTFSEIKSGGNEVALEVCDSSGYCCSGDKLINVTLPLPEYREIPPIIWLKYLFARIASVFAGF